MDKRISIIGPGAVGTAVGMLAARAGWEVAVAGRDAGRSARAASAMGERARACSIDEAAAGPVVLLTVSDDAIEKLCADLAGRGAFAPGVTVAHCSGALSSEALRAARRIGCSVASAHPLQTFPSAAAAAEKLAGTYFFCEGDEAALAVLDPLIADLGGRAVRLAGGARAKALYHAAAVMACNYLTTSIASDVGSVDAALSAHQTEVLVPRMREAVEQKASDSDFVESSLYTQDLSEESFWVATAATLFGAGVELMAEAGVDHATAMAALLPLVRATLDNIEAVGPAAALTGPIARGDVETVRRHLRALRGNKYEQIYRANGVCTVRLAQRKGSIDVRTAEEFRTLLAVHRRSMEWLRRLLTVRRWRRPSKRK